MLTTELENGQERPYGRLARMTLEYAVLFVLGFVFSLYYLAQPDVKLRPLEAYANAFTPSVMYALGYGANNIDPTTVPAIEEFLNRPSKRGILDTSDLPKEIVTVPWEPLQQIHPGLIRAVGVTWRLFGVSWDRLTILYSVFFGLTAAIAYGLFRLALYRPWAAGMTLLFMLSPAQLTILPALRDYAKAPFILAVILLTGHLIKEPPSRIRWWTFSAMLGAIIGIGLGFRQDLMICLAPAFLTVAFLVPFIHGSCWRCAIPAILLLAVAFGGTAWSTLSAMEQNGATTPHHMIGGISEQQGRILGVGGAPYNIVPSSKDYYIFSMVDSLDMRLHGRSTPLPEIPPEKQGPEARYSFLSPEFLDAARYFVMQTALRYPADWALRAYASLRYVLTCAPAGKGGAQFKLSVLGVSVSHGQWWILEHLSRWGLFYAMAVILGVSCRSMRKAGALLVMVLFWGGYPALQFHVRHIFHLSFIPYWFLGVVLQAAAWSAWRSARETPRFSLAEHARHLNVLWKQQGKPIFVFVLGALLLLFLPLWVLRVVQDASLRTYFEHYATLDLKTIPFTESPYANAPDWTLCAPDSLPPVAHAEQLATITHYIALKLKSSGPVDMRILYDFDPSRDKLALNDFSQSITISPLSGQQGSEWWYYFPVYETGPAFPLGHRRFTGIAVRHEQRQALLGMYAAGDLSRCSFLPTYVRNAEGAQPRFYEVFTGAPYSWVQPAAGKDEG